MEYHTGHWRATWQAFLGLPPQFTALPKRQRGRLWRRVGRGGFHPKTRRVFVLVVAVEVASMMALNFIVPGFGLYQWLLRMLAGFMVIAGGTLLFTFYASRRLRDEFIRHIARQCLECDYDLTGNESGVCPECGTRVPEV